MNIADKDRLCAGVGRVLKPGSVFALYDVMRTGEGEIAFPVPWAETPVTSFVATPDDYKRALVAAGFEILSERDRGELALAFFARMRAIVAESGPPPLGLHILMGEKAGLKVANTIENLERGRLAPVEIVSRKSTG